MAAENVLGVVIHDERHRLMGSSLDKRVFENFSQVGSLGPRGFG